MKRISIKSFLVLLKVLLLSSCNGVGKLHISMNQVEHQNQPHNTLIFTGITSIDNKTDSTLRINWIPHTDAIGYDIFDVTSGLLIWKSMVNGQATASATLTGLTPGQSYKFLVRAKDASWIDDENSNEFSVTMNAAPDIPNSLTLISPSSPAYFPNPTLQIGGVKPGDIIKLYSDSSCTSEVASGVANGATINLTTMNLTSASYTFYAKAVNASAIGSVCSSATAFFQVLAPSMPTSLSLVTPSTSPSFSTKPLVSISGVTSGHTIKLFSDSGCVTEIASGTATSSTINLTTSTLASGSYTFYAKAINGTASPCSTSNLSYTVYSAFNGITSITQITDSTLQINWTAHASAAAYNIYETTSFPVLFATVSAPASFKTLTGLIPGASYRFFVKAKDSQSAEDANNNNVTVATNLAPDRPGALTLISPSTSPGISVRPVVQVSGVKSGDTVKLFTDSSCITEVASGVATGTSINLTTSALAAGVYNFYANSRNTVPNISACSLATLAYTKLACPAGFIAAIAKSTLGVTNDFCVMKYEAKDVGGIATSQPAGFPWTTINQPTAAAKCAALGANFDLISNPEWMAIAHNIEANGVNWTGASVAQGALFRGHADAIPNNALDVTDVNNPWDGTADIPTDTFGKAQKRTFYLSNGEEIWDFSGNLWEWVDWTLSPGLTSGPTTCVGLNQLNAVNCAALAAIDYMPGNPAGIPILNYDSLLGIGSLNGGNGGGTMRGGNYTFGTSYSGIFAVSFNVPPGTSGSSGIGFRCVYRP
jgi:hypothetical protein